MPDWLEAILAKPTATVPNVARALGIGRNQAYEAVREGKIPAERYDAFALMALMEQCGHA